MAKKKYELEPGKKIKVYFKDERTYEGVVDEGTFNYKDIGIYDRIIEEHPYEVEYKVIKVEEAYGRYLARFAIVENDKGKQFLIFIQHMYQIQCGVKLNERHNFFKGNITTLDWMKE